MKNLFTLFALFLSFHLIGQNNIFVKINHKIENEDLTLNSEFTCYEGYEVKIERLQYYVNRFIVTHDGGQETAATEHFLINADEETILSLGEMDVNQVESIRFAVGVHLALNHEDPSTYPANHPLAPQNPSMHWGWTSGYRFVALEGKAGNNTAFNFEVHALGDDNYQSLTVENIEGTLNGTDLTINLDADYLGMFYNMDVSGGLIVHGETGHSVTLMENFATRVFFPEGGIPVKTIDPTFEGNFAIQPNPSLDKSTHVILNLPNAGEYQLTLTDIVGRVKESQQISEGNHNIVFTGNHSGIYFIHLWKDGKPMAYEKWIVK